MLITMCVSILSGCGQNASISKQDKINIVCTVFPQYDWTKEIIGTRADKFNLSLLLSSGVDMHSYKPTIDDMVSISSCDMLVYTGGVSDSWIEDALRNKKNPDMIVINLLNELGDSVKTEELAEGMEHEHDEHENDGEEYDEHVWLSLKNAEILCGLVSESLKSLDPDGADVYDKNCKRYLQALASLDGEFEKAVNASQTKTILFADRFPMRYLADDYGLSCFAAFPGCSAETETSFETVVFLARKIDELGLKSVFVLENSDSRLANTIIENTKQKNQKILVMNSMQSVTKDDISNGSSYISIMRDNLSALKSGLEE